jgi:anhydro-N-acetylmuramic acid kinase
VPANATRGSARPRVVVGLMCGTSHDGVSAAIIETLGYGTAREVRLLHHLVLAYPASLRGRLFAAFPPNSFTAAELAHLHRDFGGLLSETALEVIRRAGRNPSEIACVAVQSPTLFHEAPDGDRPGVHMEVGEAAVISERTGAPVVADLRPSDVAAGGHGAPLSAFVDHVLLSHPELGRAVQNIGGIANVTFLPAGGGMEDALAFDTGPGNLVIDGIVRAVSRGEETFDRDGRRAARGRIQHSLLTELLAHPYLERRPPKTTGREDFGDPFAERTLRRARELAIADDDLVATVTAYTAECIRLHYERELLTRGRLDEVILYGGGARNPVLVRMIQERVACAVRMHEEFGIPGDAREAVTWAILGDESLAGHPANIPSASGARHPVVLGKLVCVWPGRGRWQPSS